MGGYEAMWDRFSDEVDISEIETPEQLQQTLDQWLSPTMGSKNPAARERAIENIAEDFWSRIISSIEEAPTRIAYEYFPEEPEIRPKIELAISRALKYPVEQEKQRFGAFYGTLSGEFRKGNLLAEEVKEIWQMLRGGLI